MMRNDATDAPGLDLYLAMSAVWRSAIPETLAHESPTVLACIVDLGLRNEGVSQSEFQQTLGINQSKMSKLTKKLVEEHWIKVDEKTVGGRKVIRTTSKAQGVMATVRKDLAALVTRKTGQASSRRPKPSRKGIRKRAEMQPGQTLLKLK
jgi:DNA-binding MarR family transcriptional regulator